MDTTLDRLIANRALALSEVTDDMGSWVRLSAASSALRFHRLKLKEFTVMVWGWFPENEFEFGGSPELDDCITITAINETDAIEMACDQFQNEHSFTSVQGEIR